jgi:hypothetical protein
MSVAEEEFGRWYIVSVAYVHNVFSSKFGSIKPALYAFWIGSVYIFLDAINAKVSLVS